MPPNQGTNVKPTGPMPGPLVADPAHPGFVPQREVPGGPYYKQKGANGSKGK